MKAFNVNERSLPSRIAVALGHTCFENGDGNYSSCSQLFDTVQYSEQLECKSGTLTMWGLKKETGKPGLIYIQTTDWMTEKEFVQTWLRIVDNTDDETMELVNNALRCAPYVIIDDIVRYVNNALDGEWTAPDVLVWLSVY